MNVLMLKDITYRVKELDVLKNITINIEKGDCISIVGKSGSGKSTLLKILADLVSPSNGEIYFKGRSYSEYTPIELRRKISYCLQIPELFGDAVRENIEFPFRIRKEKVNEELVLELLKSFDLEVDILEKNIHSLSGGEKQRISLIRNLVYIPEVLLLDEATSALDMENTNLIEEYIRKINALGVTVVWVTHNVEQSMGIFNKRITIVDGIIEKSEVIAI